MASRRDRQRSRSKSRRGRGGFHHEGGNFQQQGGFPRGEAQQLTATQLRRGLERLQQENESKAFLSNVANMMPSAAMPNAFGLAAPQAPVPQQGAPSQHAGLQSSSTASWVAEFFKGMKDLMGGSAPQPAGPVTEGTAPESGHASDAAKMREEIAYLKKEREQRELDDLRSQIAELKRSKSSAAEPVGEADKLRRELEALRADEAPATTSAGVDSKLAAQLQAMRAELEAFKVQCNSGHANTNSGGPENAAPPGSASEVQWMNGDVLISPECYKEFLTFLQPGSTKRMKASSSLKEWKHREATKWELEFLSGFLKTNGIQNVPDSVAECLEKAFVLFFKTKKTGN